MEYKKSTQPVSIVPLTDASGCHPSRPHRDPDEPSRGSNQPAGIALIRADSRDSLRATVLRWATCLPAARCISGCAARNASAAAALLPLAIATSTFLTKVRIRDLRA